MRAWRVVFTSGVVHAGVLAIIALWRGATPALAVTPPVARAVTRAAPPPEVIEIDFFEDRRPAIAASSRPRVAAIGGAARPAGSVVPAMTAEPSAAAIVEMPDVPKRGLGMRGPELHPSDTALAHIADVPGHVAAPAVATVAIDSAPHGRQVMHVPGTTMVVERDGAADFNDDADIDAKFELTPRALAEEGRAFKEQAKAWLADPESFKQAARMQDLPQAMQAVAGGCGWGDPMCEATDTGGHEKLWRKTKGFTRVPILSGNLDITSYLMRRFHIGDPLASKKLEMLDATRDQRAERGAVRTQEQLDQAAILMQQNLERLWASTQNLDERRAVLFEMWDECAEGDTPIGIAGESARTMVIGWIRAHVPSGVPGAFTAAELAALDVGRGSRQHFAPY